MRQVITKAIVLSRTNFGEADRILTLLTNDQGKLRAMAKGVRKEKSKLASGVELFSVSEIGFIRGRGEIATLTTSRLNKHFGQIINNVDRTMLGYELLKCLNKIVEDNAGGEYFDLLEGALESLDQHDIDEKLIRLWFDIQLLEISGHGPNLNSEDLDKAGKYHFDNSKMAFNKHPSGSYSPNHIKLLRLARSNSPQALSKVQGIDKLLAASVRLLSSMRRTHLHV